MKLSKEDFLRLMSCDLEGRFCIEIDFLIEGDAEYHQCSMGKMPSREDSTVDEYWYGLTPDGAQAYEYFILQEFCDAPVFRGRSLFEIWDKVDFCSLDGCPFEDRIGAYL